MRKTICIIALFLLCTVLIGCQKDSNKKFSQEITVINASSSKCKTINSSAYVNQVLDVLNKIEKSPAEEESNIDWEYKIMLNVDGQEFIYLIGDIYTDSDGKQYKIENYKEIIKNIGDIYDKINVEETDYK